ncbi:YidB family protein [Vogesella oryzae]|uniref:YidB family protein n=1 Tax=Vogesella oryzae TaxID=1735285 RepID=UPI0015838F03|nr:YidB family protein [Vogesella oryzae]
MSLFDQLGGLLGGDGSNNLLQSAQTLLNDNGGVSGLVEKFQQGGLGEIVSSWVGTGDNLAISAEQIQSVLGNEQIAGLAAKLGLDSNQLAQQVAEHLPTLIDRLTPNSEVPQGNDLLSQGASLLGGLFKS